MFPFGVTIPATVLQRSEIPEGLMNYPVFKNQLQALFFFVYVYFNYLHVSIIQVLIISRFNCINTIAGICHSENK